MRRALESLKERLGSGLLSVGSLDDGQRRREGPQGAADAALDAALGAIGAPAVIIDDRGKIVCANQEARGLIGRRDPQRWDRTPVGNAGARAWFLAVLRPEPAESPKALSVSAARARWNLTARQSEVLGLVADGMTNANVADALNIRVGTVEFHVKAIFDKAGASNRGGLIARLMELSRGG